MSGGFPDPEVRVTTATGRIHVQVSLPEGGWVTLCTRENPAMARSVSELITTAMRNHRDDSVPRKVGTEAPPARTVLVGAETNDPVIDPGSKAPMTSTLPYLHAVICWQDGTSETIALPSNRIGDKPFEGEETAQGMFLRVQRGDHTVLVECVAEETPRITFREVDPERAKGVMDPEKWSEGT